MKKILYLNFSRKAYENKKLFASPGSYVSAGCYMKPDVSNELFIHPRLRTTEKVFFPKIFSTQSTQIETVKAKLDLIT